LSTPSERSGRFGDWTPLQSLCQTGSAAGARPFFAGSTAYARMDTVRKAINDIRTNWGNYPQFMHELRDLMVDSEFGHLGNSEIESLQALFSSVKKWSAGPDEEQMSDYSAVRLYTSEYGYRKMFNTINKGFRSDELADDQLALRASTFLVELLSIDLFNYLTATPQADNFEGQVYRGMCVSDRDLAEFHRLMKRPIQDRYLSIPLAMMSASRVRGKALSFALKEARAPGRHPLLWNIRVSGLNPELLSVYMERFPTSVVTSLCAVPIEQLSDYPQEGEVLLRGPHFQILSLRKEKTDRIIGDLHVIDAVMLNSNRDHISAVASNVGEDRVARDLFRAIIGIHRSTICAEYATSHSLSGDVKSYHMLASENRQIIEAITATN